MVKRFGFTLIELLLVIGIIAILAAIVILAINPTLQLTKAQDAKRTSNAREIQSAINQYIIDNGFPPTDMGGTAEPICRYGAADKTGCIDLDALVDEDYLVTLEPDVKESDVHHLGYTVLQSNNGFLAVEPTYVGQSGAAPIVASVVSRKIFYNNSAFDTATDSDAIATDKSPLFTNQTAAFTNYTSYSKGINGIIIDIANPNGTLVSSDFSFATGNNDTPSGWAAAPAPLSITTLDGQGSNGSDRVVIIWADNVIQKQWLQVKVLATANTGLSVEDTHYWGNAIGEVGNSTLNFFVDGTDSVSIRDNPVGTALITNIHDIDRDGDVDDIDEDISQANPTSVFNDLSVITPL